MENSKENIYKKYHREFKEGVIKLSILCTVIAFIFFGAVKTCSDKFFKPKYPDELFYKNSQILEIKRDDDGHYHLLVKYENGMLESINDESNVIIWTGNYKPTAVLPFIKSYNNIREKIYYDRGWESNQSIYDNTKIRVYLPISYEIKLFTD